MRKLTAGNKRKFLLFTFIIIVILAILIVFLNKMLNVEKEQYEITKDVFIYDSNYEHINLTQDAIISKKWTGKYYLSEPETGLSYDLGPSNIGYDIIKNRLSLYGNFYEVSLDGEVTKHTKNTEVSDILNSKLYKIDDRKYLIVGKNITVENSSMAAENYLIVIIDRSGNTLLLNNTMDIKTINAIVLQTDTFKFDVPNEKMIVNDTKIDLTKIIGSTNEYTPKKEKVEEIPEEEQIPNGGTTVNVGGSISNSSNSSNAQAGGAILNNGGNSNSSNNGGNNNSSNNGNSSSNNTNNTKIVKSINLRSVSVGATYLDVNYRVFDPESKYQVVYLYVTGPNYENTIALDKIKETYRIESLEPNTEYNITMGYKVLDMDNNVQTETEDVINVRTAKLEETMIITKVTNREVYFNLKLDSNYVYDSAQIKVYVDGIESKSLSKDVNIAEAISNSGWLGSIEKPDGSQLTLKLENVKYNGVLINTTLQSSIKL